MCRSAQMLSAGSARARERSGCSDCVAFSEISSCTIYRTSHGLGTLVGVEREPQCQPVQQGQVRWRCAEHAAKCTCQMGGVREPGAMSCGRDAEAIPQIACSALQAEPENVGAHGNADRLGKSMHEP